MAKYRIEVDQNACVGDRLCREEAPATFGEDDNGKTIVKNPDGDPPEDIRAAAEKCRLLAISLYDAETDKKVWP